MASKFFGARSPEGELHDLALENSSAPKKFQVPPKSMRHQLKKHGSKLFWTSGVIFLVLCYFIHFHSQNDKLAFVFTLLSISASALMVVVIFETFKVRLTWIVIAVFSVLCWLIAYRVTPFENLLKTAQAKSLDYIDEQYLNKEKTKTDSLIEKKVDSIIYRKVDSIILVKIDSLLKIKQKTKKGSSQQK